MLGTTLHGVGEMEERCVIYARISVKGEDISNQVQNIQQWAEQHNYEIAGVFLDEAITGASDPLSRPKFSSMLDFCRDNNIRTILVWDLARFGRSLPEAVVALRKLLDQGFKVIFTRYNLIADLNDISGKVMIYTLLMASELERDFLRMRMEAARAAGKMIHRPPTPIPIDEVRKLIEKGWTLKQIHAYLIGKGLLKYKEKGQEKVLGYKQFVYRLVKEGVRRRKK